MKSPPPPPPPCLYYENYFRQHDWTGTGTPPNGNHFTTMPLLSKEKLHSFPSVSYNIFIKDAKKQCCESGSHKVPTYIHWVPQFMSPRRNWDSPTHSLASECTPPPGTKGGDTRLRVRGWGESQFRRLEKKLSTLPTLCRICTRVRVGSRFNGATGSVSGSGFASRIRIRIKKFWLRQDLGPWHGKKLMRFTFPRGEG